MNRILLLAGLACVLTLALAGIALAETNLHYINTAWVSSPWGNTAPHDYNHKVPEYLGDNTPGGIGIARMVCCPAKWHIVYERSFWNTHPQCRDRMRAHERAHARGWGHYEGNPSINPAYYPSFQC